MKIFKENMYALLLVAIVAILVFILITYNKSLGDYTPVFSAVIGAVSGSLGAYIVSKINGSAEKKKSKRRILYLLKVTFKTFGDLEEGNRAKIYCKFIYDDKWSDYIAYLDDVLSFEEIVYVVEWFNSLYLMEETIKDYNNKLWDNGVTYQGAQQGVVQYKEAIKNIIEKLESK